MFNTTNERNSSDIAPIADSRHDAVIVLQLFVFITIILTAFAGNMLVCIAVCKFRQLQTTTNIALVSLAVTDVLMVYVIILHAIMMTEGRWTMGDTLCEVSSSIGLTLNVISLLHLAYISLDRFVAIIKPFRYHIWITKKRATIAVLYLWLITVLLLNSPWGDFEYRANVFGCLSEITRGSVRPATLTILIVFVSFPSACILFTQVWVCIVARGHAKKMTRQQCNLQVCYSTGSPPVTNSESDRRDSTRTNIQAAFRREMKSVKTFGILVGCFLVCYIPFYTVATFRSFNGLNTVPSKVLTTVTWCGFVNSAVNPIIYSLRHRQFKNAFEKIFKKGLARITPLPVTGARE